MIYLITGLPGNGKTLYTLWHVKERAERESRQVFYSGIPELKIDSWVEFEKPELWNELPDGAIIVIDEAQRAFRPRPGRGDPPAHIADLETHRHKGYDLYVITQHPSLIDQNVRRLAGTHRHVVRTFGAQRAVIHEWGEVRMDCERRRTDSSKTTWKYPKNVFDLYKSAELHTHKMQLPKQVYYLVIALVLLIALFVKIKLGVDELTKKPDPDNPDTLLVDNPDSYAVTRQGQLVNVRSAPVDYFGSQQPRIRGMPHTAPRYDELTIPAETPVVSGCISMQGRCRCYTQRATPVDMAPEFCEALITQGLPFYDHLLADGAMPDRSKRSRARGSEFSGS
jgi:hypothetical protein